MTDIPQPKFDHLLRMTDARGTFEHAEFAEARTETGYCTDDMARVLVVTARERGAGGAIHRLAGVALRFLNEAQTLSGACRNRMDSAGTWVDEPAVEDPWGRCLWGLGTAAAHSDVRVVRKLGVIQFERAAQSRSVWPRAMAYAALGAAELLTVVPGNAAARALVTDYVAGIPAPTGNPAWPWPETRLTYANAVLAEAMIAAGVALDMSPLLNRGLDLLGWLVESETSDGHLSPTPITGRSVHDLRPGFDQQPIEVAALADACARAATVDPRPIWPVTVRAAAAWFQGANDAGEVMWDPQTGGGFDGLHADGVNLNQGTESTLAVISTFQQAQRFLPDPP
ncbi:glycosyltransferase, group I [Mycolicibacterium mageritense DSM 44476 = CIP 104973]|nr:glycosyltransferase, group I [Mycolicibacterium mageritense DSM 44476 = CIP 104973]